MGAGVQEKRGRHHRTLDGAGKLLQREFAASPDRHCGDNGKRVLASSPAQQPGLRLILDPLQRVAFGRACRLLLSSKSGRRPQIGGLPTEEIIDAGPGVDLGLAHLAAETAGTRFRVLLFCRGVIDPAIGAGEMFNRPYAAGHPANMRRASPVFQHRTLPPLMTHYPSKGPAPISDLRPINLRPHLA
jgi:hypothetical protein